MKIFNLTILKQNCTKKNIYKNKNYKSQPVSDCKLAQINLKWIIQHLYTFANSSFCSLLEFSRKATKSLKDYASQMT